MLDLILLLFIASDDGLPTIFLSVFQEREFLYPLVLLKVCIVTY